MKESQGSRPKPRQKGAVSAELDRDTRLVERSDHVLVANQKNKTTQEPAKKPAKKAPAPAPKKAPKK